MRGNQGTDVRPQGSYFGTLAWHCALMTGFLMAALDSVCLALIAIFSFFNSVFQFDPDGYFWAVIHLFCVGKF